MTRLHSSWGSDVQRGVGHEVGRIGTISFGRSIHLAMNYQHCNAKTDKSNEGMLKTNGPPFRMGQARRRSRHFAVLTYWKYAPRVNTKGVPLRDKLSNYALRDVASNTAALLNNFYFDHSRRAPDSEFFCGLYGLFARNIQQIQ